MRGIAAALLVAGSATAALAQTAPLPPPKFHHLMLNSVDPEKAIAFYLKAFPSTKRMDWGGSAAHAGTASRAPSAIRAGNMRENMMDRENGCGLNDGRPRG